MALEALVVRQKQLPLVAQVPQESAAASRHRSLGQLLYFQKSKSMPYLLSSDYVKGRQKEPFKESKL